MNRVKPKLKVLIVLSIRDSEWFKDIFNPPVAFILTYCAREGF